MQKSKFIKTITLSSFILLISTLVAYRSGAFSSLNTDNPVMANKTVYTDNELAVDSPPAKKVMMSSSKSGPVFVEKDSKTKLKNDSINRQRDIMSSSKSASVFDEQDVKASPQNTTVVSPTVSVSPSYTFNPNAVIIPSSKSGGVFRPLDLKVYSITPVVSPTRTVKPAPAKPANNQNNNNNSNKK